MRGFLLMLVLCAATPAGAQVIGPLEDHARLLSYGVGGSGYARQLEVLPDDDGPSGRLLVTAQWEELAGFAQAGVVYALDKPSDNDPAQGGGTFFEGGAESLRRLGRAVAVGDFDANGFNDVVFGANDQGFFDHGSVFIRWGSADGDGPTQHVATQSDQRGGAMGASLSVADLNDDGFDDLVVGDPNAYPGLFDELSRVLLFYGSSELGPAGDGEPLAEWPAVILGEGAGVTGEFVSAAADWNCDGRNDLLLGGKSGRLFLLLNPEDGEAWPQSTGVRSALHHWVEILGSLASPNIDVDRVADLTGDGCADILLGLDEASERRGEVVLVAGRDTADWGPSESSKELEEIAWIRRRGRLPDSLAAHAVQPVYWLNASGGDLVKPDLLVGAPRAVVEELDFEPAGRVLFIPGAAIFGPHGEPVEKDPPGSLPADHPRLDDLSPYLFEGRTLDLELGSKLALWEDVDNDGLRDVAVTAPGYRLDPEQTSGAEGAVFILESSSAVEFDGDGAAPYEDCDDGDATIFPGAEEICDGDDNDCNGVADAGDPGVDTESDLDEDGVSICEGDCDDEVATTAPNAEELCNGVDDDCDNRTDENWDSDGDGAPDANAEPCADLAESGGADCDDSDPAVHPEAGDGPGFQDSDCDGASEWSGGCSCTVTRSMQSEVASDCWILLAIVSVAARRRRE